MVKKITRSASQAPSAGHPFPGVDLADQGSHAQTLHEDSDGLSDLDEGQEELRSQTDGEPSPERQLVDATPEPETLDATDTTRTTEHPDLEVTPSAGNSDQYRASNEETPDHPDAPQTKSIEEQIREAQRNLVLDQQRAILRELEAQQTLVTLRLEAAEATIAKASHGISEAEPVRATAKPNSTEHQPIHEPRVNLPKISDYYGRTIREEVVFIRECTLHHRLMPVYFREDSIKILNAMAYLKGTIADAWHRILPKAPLESWSWIHWDEWLKDEIDDKEVRENATAQKLKEARQGDRQSPLDLLVYIETLELDLPESTEKQKLQNFWTALRPDLRNRITLTGQTQDTRAECVKLASRLHTAMYKDTRPQRERQMANPEDRNQKRQDRRPSNRRMATPRSGPPFQRAPYSGPPRNENGPSAGVNARPPTDPATVTCHSCQKKGHFARDCPTGHSRQVNTIDYHSKNDAASL